MANKFKLPEYFSVITTKNNIKAVEAGKVAVDAVYERVSVHDIIHKVGNIHANATCKYPPFCWESNFSEAADSTPVCNLNAIMRHTLEMTFGNYIDNDSGLPHTDHLLCRLEMLITSLFSNGQHDELRPQDYVSDEQFTSDATTNMLVAPEFVKYLCMLTPSSIALISETYVLQPNPDQYTREQTVSLRARIWLADYLAMRKKLGLIDTDGSFKPALQGDDLMNWAIPFGETMLAFALSTAFYIKQK